MTSPIETAKAAPSPNFAKSIKRAQKRVKKLGIAKIYPFNHHFHATPHGEMHYVDEGKGDVILMVHGNPTWSFLYREFISEFGKNHRVVAPDHIGFGLSQKPPRRDIYTLEMHIANLEALIIELGLTNITLLVHDWGGPIGLGMAARHPERIKSIVVMNSFGAFPPSPKADPENIKLPLPLKLLRSKGVGTFLVRRLGMFERVLMGKATANAKRLKSVASAYSAVFRGARDRSGVLAFPRMIPNNSRHPSALIMLEEITPFLKAYTKPIQIFWGLKDPFLTLDMLEGWKDIVPQAQITRYPSAKHYIQEDAYAEMLPLMKAFVEHTET